MLRWSQDIVFLRVIRVSLIAIALMLGLILANVFVDFDSFFMSKTHNKKDAGKYMTFDDNVYNKKNFYNKSTVNRIKRAFNYSLKSIYEDKNKMEINTGNDAVDPFQLNNLEMIMQFLHNGNDSQLNLNTMLNTLFKLRSKRQVEYADDIINKPKNTIKNNNSTMEDSKHIDIEIKTHFNSKTTNVGRKEFITHLIEKIRRALRSDTEVISNQIENEPYFKTREQEPIGIANKIINKSKNFPRFTNEDDKRMGNYNTIQRYKIPKFKYVKRARSNEYTEYKNSLERRYQKPIADNTENKVIPELNLDYNLSFLLNNTDGAAVSMDRVRYPENPSGLKSYYNSLDNVVKIYHNTIT